MTRIKFTLEAFHGRASQRGYVTMVVVVCAVLATLSLLTSKLNASIGRRPMEQVKVTQNVLRSAKAALVAFAAENPARPGGLPCPDLNDDGEAELSCDQPRQRIGRLPWQTLNSRDLRDSSGERLWYSVSAGYRNDPDAIINSRTQGDIEIRIRGSDGRNIASAEPAVAVVIAPGRALPNQNRLGANRNDPAQYLEAGVVARWFEVGRTRDGNNDSVEVLTRGELMTTIERVVGARIRAEILPVIRRAYLEVWGALPYPKSLTGSAHDPDVTEATYPYEHSERTVGWLKSSISVSQSGGTGVLASADCNRSSDRTIDCELRYAGQVQVRVDATAADVGRVWAAALTSADVSASAPLDGVLIVNEPLDRDGNARISVRTHLPLGDRTRLRVNAPIDIAGLTEATVPTNAPLAWFARNQWYRQLDYQISPRLTPGGNAPSGIDPSAASDQTIEIMLHRWRVTALDASAPNRPMSPIVICARITHDPITSCESAS